jgi:hypothetical protein
MKGLLIGLMIVIILISAGFFGYKYYSRTKVNAPAAENSPTVKLSGMIQKAKGDDYNFIIIANGKSTGVSSYTLKFDTYVGKNVEITGQYSGSTLYVDTIALDSN